MNPIFVPSITYESIEAAKQCTLHLIKAVADDLAWDMKFLSDGVGREANRLFRRIVCNCDGSDARRERLVVIVETLAGIVNYIEVLRMPLQLFDKVAASINCHAFLLRCLRP